MLENLYTTKMSMDKEKLQARFAKIQAEPGRRAKGVGVVVFALLLAVMAGTSACIAIGTAEDCAMTDQEFSAYISQPIGAGEDVPDLYDITSAYMEDEFRRVYSPYYDIQNLTLSAWKQNGNEATFFYTMTYLYYNRDPDKVAYIQDAKKGNRETYESLYKDYLALKQSNYEFKVIWNDETLELYYENSVKGPASWWGPITVDDFIAS